MAAIPENIYKSFLGLTFILFITLTTAAAGTAVRQLVLVMRHRVSGPSFWVTLVELPKGHTEIVG